MKEVKGEGVKGVKGEGVKGVKGGRVGVEGVKGEGVEGMIEAINAPSIEHLSQLHHR